MTEAMSVDVIANRFAESETLLEHSFDRLRSLPLAESAATASSASIEQASSAMRETADALTEAVRHSGQALASLDDAMLAAQSILSGSQLAGMEKATASQAKALSQLSKRVYGLPASVRESLVEHSEVTTSAMEDLADLVANRFDELDHQLTEMKALRARADRAEATLRTVRDRATKELRKGQRRKIFDGLDD